MKNCFIVLLMLLAIHLHGQSQTPLIVLTAKDVKTNSVRVITPPTISSPNLVFEYIGKTSEEIKAISKSHPKVQIAKNGITIAKTPYVSLWYKVKNGQTNCVGLVLIFTNYAEAKLAEKTLRGN
jgi:hypothetical protein